MDNFYNPTAEYRALFKRLGVKRSFPRRPAAATSCATDSVAVDPWPVHTHLLSAEFLIYYRIVQELGFREDLIETWGDETADSVLSLAFLWLHTANNAT